MVKTDLYRLFFQWTPRVGLLASRAMLWSPQRRGGLDTHIRTDRRDWFDLLSGCSGIQVALASGIFPEALGLRVR